MAPPGAGHAGPIHAGAAEIQLVRTAQFGQQRQMQTVPYAGGLPVTQPPPAGHAAAKAQFLGQVLPRRARAQHEQDAILGPLITQSRPAALWRRLHGRQQPLKPFVQRRADFFVPVFSHAVSIALRAPSDDRLLLAALST